MRVKTRLIERKRMGREQRLAAFAANRRIAEPRLRHAIERETLRAGNDDRALIAHLHSTSGSTARHMRNAIGIDDAHIDRNPFAHALGDDAELLELGEHALEVLK